MSLLEPSFGVGDFLLIAVERLLAACLRQSEPVPEKALAFCIRAVELHRSTYESTRTKLIQRLCAAGINHSVAMELASQWLVHGDFLLIELSDDFDFVVGNPLMFAKSLFPMCQLPNIGRDTRLFLIEQISISRSLRER